jgi:hypothetical protein
VEIEYEESLGACIRRFFREFLGSRLVERLELDLAHLRNDFDQRLHDKDLIIASLREEKAQLNAKIIVYENTVMAHSSKLGAEVVAYQKPAPAKPNFSFVDMPPTKSRWQQVQDEHDARIAKEEAEELAQKAATAASKE